MIIPSEESILFIFRHRLKHICSCDVFIPRNQMRRMCEGTFVEYEDKLWYKFPILGVAINENNLSKLLTRSIDKNKSRPLYNELSIMINKNRDKIIVNTDNAKVLGVVLFTYFTVEEASERTDNWYSQDKSKEVK